MPDLSHIQDWANTVLGGLAGAAASFFALRRKYSQDTTAIARDKVETQLITTLMTERDLAMREARDAREQRMIDVGRIAHLEGLVEAGERETKRLREELFAMRLHLRKLTAMLAKIDPQAAQAMQIDANGDGIDFQEVGKHA